MKKQFFTFLMMIALVIVAGSAMAQADTNLKPSPSKKYSYTWKNVNTGTGGTHDFLYSSSPTDPNAAIAISLYAEDNEILTDPEITTSGDLVNESAVAYITWDKTAAGQTYYLWLQTQTTGASGCLNYRYVKIEVAIDYQLEVLGFQPHDVDATTLDGVVALTQPVGELCLDFADRTDAIFNSEGNLDDDGSLYLVFKASQVATGDYGWAASFTTTSSATPEYLDPADDTWKPYTVAVNVADEAVQYFRLKLAAVLVPDPNVTLDATLAVTEATTGKTDGFADNNTGDAIAKAIPAIGDFE